MAFDSLLASLVNPLDSVADRSAVDRELLDQVEQERELLHRLMSVLAHDLRTPLTAIIASVTLLLRSDPPPDQMRTGLLRIRQSAGRMNRMIANVIDLTRMRVKGELPLATAPTDLEKIARSLVDEIGVAYPDREMTVTCKGDTRGKWDRDRLGQVLANLLTNAINYGAPGTPISVELEDRGPTVAVIVRNRGPVIPTQDMERLFQPFQRGSDDAVSASPGLGLGLFVADEIVAAHGGHISATSDHEDGTAFEVVLPRVMPKGSGR